MPNSRAIPDISILYKLPYLTAVVKEGLVLCPPPRIDSDELQQSCEFTVLRLAFWNVWYQPLPIR